MKKYLLVTFLLGLAAGCKHHSPATAVHSDTTTTTSQPPQGQPTNNNRVIFADALASGGGAFEYPGGGEPTQVLRFDDNSNPLGTKSIRYTWTGADVAGQHAFAGFDLMHVGDISLYAGTPGINLQSGNYKRVTFDARGTLGTSMVAKIEVADDGNTNTAAPCVVLSANGTDTDAGPGVTRPCLNTASLTSGWNHYSIAVTNSDLLAVKDYFKSTLIYNGTGTGTGGTIYFDNIQYEP